MRIFCNAKDSHIFPTKNNCICNINILNFNETLTNDVANFKQSAPDLGLCYFAKAYLDFIIGNQIAHTCQEKKDEHSQVSQGP